MNGTAAMSGSPAAYNRKRFMAAGASSRASSMLMSMMAAPFSIWWRAMAIAPGISSALTMFRNLRDPATLVRSPILMKFLSREAVNALRPERRSRRGRDGGTRGFTPSSTFAMAAMCAGVVPQHPPAILRCPASASERITAAI